MTLTRGRKWCFW